MIGDTSDGGLSVFRAENDKEITQTLRVDSAFLLSDRWQVGASLPLVRRALSRTGVDNSATALGDLRVNGAYEILPEWSYSAWRPKGYLFTQVIFPLGRSIYESKSAGAVDAIGQGFYTMALGSLLLKRWGDWDVFLMPEIHYSLPRSFSEGGDSLSVAPGFGSSAALGLGVSPWGGDLRVGLRIQPAYAARKKVTTASEESLTAYQLVWDSALELGYLIEENWSLSAAYTDQTLLGPANGTTLSRSVSLSLQHRFSR